MSPSSLTLQSGPNPIVAKVYDPGGEVEYAVILSSATGAKQSFYTKFARYLCEQGFLVVTYDYSGIGESAPKKMRGYESSLEAWGKDDLTAVIEYVVANHHYKKLVHMGLSVAGQIAPLSPAIDQVDGFFHVASSTAYWRMWPFPIAPILWINWHFLIAMCHIWGYFPAKAMNIMENLPKGVGLNWATWGLKKEYLFDALPEAQAQFSRLKKPLISYSFTDDTTAPKNTIDWLNGKYTKCQLLQRHIDPKAYDLKKIGHFGFFRSESRVLWEMAVADMRENI